MIALEHAFREGRRRAADLGSPLMLKIGLWLLVLGWSASIAFHWLRDAAATPPPPAVVEPRPPIDLEAAIAQAAAALVFGEAVERVTAPAALAAPLDIKLKGVFAGGGGPTAAIVSTGEDDDAFVLLGREVAPGAVVEAIHPTHIVVRREGSSHRIALEPVKSDASRSKAAARASGPRAGHNPRAAPSTPAAEAPATPAEAEPATPLAPPMPQSEAAPDRRSRHA